MKRFLRWLWEFKGLWEILFPEECTEDRPNKRAKYHNGVPEFHTPYCRCTINGYRCTYCGKTWRA